MRKVEHVTGTWADVEPKYAPPMTPYRKRPKRTLTEVRQDFDGHLTVPLRRGNARYRRRRRRHDQEIKNV